MWWLFSWRCGGYLVGDVVANWLEMWSLLGCRYGCYLVVVMWWLLGCSDVVTIPGWRRGGYLVRDEREWKREGESG